MLINMVQSLEAVEFCIFLQIKRVGESDKCECDVGLLHI